MLIYYLSAARFRPDFSNSLLSQALAFLQLSVPFRTFALLGILLRKSAHVIEYGLLAGFLCAGFREKDPSGWRLGRGLWCVCIAAAYSLTDELHQASVPGRNASLVDCGIDATGAAIAVALVYLSQKLLQRIRSRPTRELTSDS
jgi:VanZ family protein